MADKEAAATVETVSKADYEAALEKARRFEAQLTDKEKTLEKFKGIDPVKYSAIIEENEILKKEGAGNDKSKWEKIVQDSIKKTDEAWSTKVTEWQTKAQQLESEVNHFKVTVPATQKLAEKKCLPEQMPLMNMLVEKELILTPDGVRVKGEDGKPVRSKANPGKEMDLDEWTDSLVNKFPSAFASEAIPGARVAGKATTASSSSGITPEKYIAMGPEGRAKLSPTERQNLAAQYYNMPTRQTVPVKPN